MALWWVESTTLDGTETDITILRDDKSVIEVHFDRDDPNMANVQIPQDVFLNLVRLHCSGTQDSELEKRICNALEDKLSAMAAQQQYAANQ